MLKEIRFTKTKIYFQKFSVWDWTKVLLGAVLIYGIITNWEVIGGLLALVKDREAIIEFVGSYGAYGPVLLAIAIILQVIFAAIPGHLLMFACGYLYGFSKGFLLTWITTILASQATFLMARKAGKPLVYRFASKDLIDKWEPVANKQGIVFFIFSFMLPIFPVDVMTYVAGFASISPRRFLIANLIGHIPVAVLMNLAGAYGFELSTGWIIAIVAVGITVMIIWLSYLNKVEEKLNIAQGGA